MIILRDGDTTSKPSCPRPGADILTCSVISRLILGVRTTELFCCLEASLRGVGGDEMPVLGFLSWLGHSHEDRLILGYGPELVYRSLCGQLSSTAVHMEEGRDY